MNWNTFIIVIISFGSLGVSIWAIIESKRANRRSLQTNHKMLELEQKRERERDQEKQIQKKKAELYAKIEEDTISSRTGHKTLPGYWLRIYNCGLADARGVKALINEKSLTEYQYIRDDTKEILEIKAKSHISYIIQWTVVVPPAHEKSFSLKITWEDGLGQHEWEQIITP